jgi:hypothetical protein
LRRLENKGLQKAGVVEATVLERVPVYTAERVMFLTDAFLIYP